MKVPSLKAWASHRRTPKLFLMWSVFPLIELAHSLLYLLSLGFIYSSWGMNWLKLMLKEEFILQAKEKAKKAK